MTDLYSPLRTDGSGHDMQAEARVPLDAEITEFGLEATQQLDMDITRWTCSCGESWTDKEDAEDHLRVVRNEQPRSETR